MSRRAPRSRNTLRTSRLLTCVLAVSALIIGTVVPATAASASVSASSTSLARASVDPAAAGIAKSTLVGFAAGNIISDAVFTNKNSMTEAQIQSFFNSKVSRCLGGRDENGRAIVCLKDFRITSVTRPADAYCKGYTGAANESAARIIYRVAQSCNINPQVLIVMLQKEQSLVDHTWPSAWRYDIALGQGCPDTAACDPKYVGFFHQIYGAARQMQIYMEGKWFQWYAPGKTWNVLFHPESARGCGTAPVYMANKATSALYYYTPYQPNAAALRANWGEGDRCSSYGNRNFYNYFTTWFGSTQKPVVDPLGDIRRLHTSLGGATGVLGAAKTNPACTAATARCTVTYANGIITWTSALGARTVYGAVYKQYVAQGGLGGKLGYPKTSPTAVTDPNGNGVAQQFDKGWIHQSAAGAYMSTNRTMTAYSAAGWIRGKLSWPVGPEVCTAQSCLQDFVGGVIGALTGKPAVAVVGTNTKAIDDVHTANGGSGGALGAAKASFVFVQDAKGSGIVRQYANGWIHASAAGAFVTSNALMTAYSGAGWLRGTLGWPTSDESKVTDPNGNGAAQSFQGGWIHSSAKGAFTSSTRVMAAFSKAGWVRGALAWPVSTELCTGASCTQAFAGGIISFTGSAEATSSPGVTSAAIAKVRADPKSSPVALGSAVGAATIVADAHGGGLAQKFSGGWIHSSAAGTFASSNTIMTAYSKAGWLRGKLGWPSGAETCTTTSCIQAFQGGTIAYQKGKAAVLLVGVEADAVDVAFAAQGGSSGALGAAAADLTVVSDPHGNGLVRKFTNGWIHASATGTFVTSNALMTAYSGAGWLRGALGWPTSGESSVTDPNGNGVTQSFQGGRIHSSAKGTFASSSTIMTAYSKAGWLRGELGWPTGAETCSATACSQAFQGGSISYVKGKAATVVYR